MLQHSKRTLTRQQQRQLWERRRRAHQTRRAIRKQERLQQAKHRSPSKRSRQTPSAVKADQTKAAPGQSPAVRRSRRYSQDKFVRPYRQTPSTQSGLLAYVIRLSILGAGVAAIAGTVLSVIDPKPRSVPASSHSSSNLAAFAPPTKAKEQGQPQKQGQPIKPKTFDPPAETPQSLFYRWSQEPRLNRLIREGQELSAIKQQIQQWSAAQPELSPALFFLNPDTGDYLDINSTDSISAASTIKIPVLLAFFEDVDAGKIALDESLVMRQDLVASEAGSMQYQQVGTRFSALETAEYMIAISDNTATNMLIDRLGGAQKLNQRFKSWGLKHTVIRNPLPDLEGTNTISPRDMATLMLKLRNEDLLLPKSRGQALDILRQTVTKTLLPQGLDKDANIAHKTGDIGSVVGDIGLIDMPNGQHYVAAILVQRPHNDPRAQELIRKISKLTYQTFRAQGQPGEAATPPELAN
ncbi:serine hydrolase [Acaryochloris sp. IP29b_bin.137]|uniref:serine hydrolase n=1 Tax=Acaryochloris sp. IP29b_bin.137 TaxID=2969217 RepID=UPI002634F013|nr:serine hydrolase [Acaryochloris sp. IP29b_bin.137]